ncbi:hypothetical protein BDV24DRAFT_154670 [Aspergillus arachidicola]|uniref:Ketoreductase domain-containing protein n=1 Tax=Aspergillus arachidicola TaxID=656916 RepID=A0A5N6XY20_9EURO|nr:hypothetical protein BDV24DRAFT_154670 [Aspergillus arachidicola]
MASYLITGASRGLGLDLVRSLATKPATDVSIVYAAARTQTDALKQLSSDAAGRVAIVPLDVESEESIKRAVSHVERSQGNRGLDVLINVAGIMSHFPQGITTMDDLNYVFNTNVTGVHLLTQSFLPLLKKGTLKKVINYSSGLGSIGNAAAWAAQDSPSYKVSKAALNMLTVQYALSLADDGFTFIVLSPGWVKTDLGGDDADIDVGTSTNAVLDLITHVRREDNGKFFNIRVAAFDHRPEPFQYAGEEIPW